MIIIATIMKGFEIEKKITLNFFKIVFLTIFKHMHLDTSTKNIMCN